MGPATNHHHFEHQRLWQRHAPKRPQVINVEPKCWIEYWLDCTNKKLISKCQSNIAVKIDKCKLHYKRKQTWEDCCRDKTSFVLNIVDINTTYKTRSLHRPDTIVRQLCVANWIDQSPSQVVTSWCVRMMSCPLILLIFEAALFRLKFMGLILLVIDMKDWNFLRALGIEQSKLQS